MKPSKVYSFLEIIPVEKVEKNRKEFINTFFDDSEKLQINEKPVRTIAGFIALKKSLVNLANRISSNNLLTEKDFILSHNENGAPLIKEFKSKEKLITNFSVQKIRISITHTKKYACALSVYQEEEDVI